jgi:hypothetical protein
MVLSVFEYVDCWGWTVAGSTVRAPRG